MPFGSCINVRNIASNLAVLTISIVPLWQRFALMRKPDLFSF